MPRLMANAEFRNHQWIHRYDEDIAPFNRFIDELCKAGATVPYIAPIYGGVNARLLSVLSDPGPKTQAGNGSGFLCLENDDATAERMCELIAEAKIDVSDMLPWNAYPWYITPKHSPKAAEIKAGVEPLKRIIELLPKLLVVILHGCTARNCWKKLTVKYPSLVEERRLHIIETYHTGRQAFWHPDEKEREARKLHLRVSLHRAAYLLHETEMPNQFTKKSDKTPPRDLETAQRRMKEYKNAHSQRT